MLWSERGALGETRWGSVGVHRDTCSPSIVFVFLYGARTRERVSTRMRGYDRRVQIREKSDKAGGQRRD